MSYLESSNRDIISQQDSRESNARSYPRQITLAIREAQGIKVTDMDGNVYYDCLAGAGTLILGHNHPQVVEAVESFLCGDRPLQTLDISSPAKERFIDSLYASLPDEFTDGAKIQFCSPAGTDAVEAALKLVKTATDNRSILAFRGAYHGMTSGALSLMGNTEPKEPIPGLMRNVHHLPFPYEYRCPFGSTENGYQIAIEYIENLFYDNQSGITDPAGMILEPVQGEGGSIPAPDPWLQEIRRITREQNIPLILDEIQSGLGRTGEIYAFEHADIIPDVVTLSKSIGGGFPLAVLIFDESLDHWEPGAHAGTFRGNQIAMVAGEATIDYVLENNLDGRAANVGGHLYDLLKSISEQFDKIGDVRGCGLMLGVEFVNTSADWRGAGPYAPNKEFAATVQSECLDRGLIIELGGRRNATARFLPPLNVSKHQVEDIAAIFQEAVTAASNNDREPD